MCTYTDYIFSCDVDLRDNVILYHELLLYLLSHSIYTCPVFDGTVVFLWLGPVVLMWAGDDDVINAVISMVVMWWWCFRW